MANAQAIAFHKQMKIGWSDRDRPRMHDLTVPSGSRRKRPSFVKDSCQVAGRKFGRVLHYDQRGWKIFWQLRDELQEGLHAACRRTNGDNIPLQGFFSRVGLHPCLLVPKKRGHQLLSHLRMRSVDLSGLQPAETGALFSKGDSGPIPENWLLPIGTRIHRKPPDLPLMQN